MGGVALVCVLSLLLRATTRDLNILGRVYNQYVNQGYCMDCIPGLKVLVLGLGSKSPLALPPSIAP